MKRSRTRAVRPSVEGLEGRQLLSGDGLALTWIGQAGNDRMGPTPWPGPSGVQDVQIRLEGLPRDREVVFVAITNTDSSEWNYRGTQGRWAAGFERTGPETGELFFEPYKALMGWRFDVLVRFDDGETITASVSPRTVDPTLRVPEAALQVAWVGQDGGDWVGSGPSVGPDGVQDVHLVLTGLAKDVAIEAILIDGPAGAAWRYGQSREAISHARLQRSATDPSRADLYLNPGRNLDGQELTVLVVYANGPTDQTIVTAGPTDPALRVAAPEPPPTERAGLSARWRGQDGFDSSRPGLVHLSLEGLPAGRRVVGAVLSDEAGYTWVNQIDPSAPLYTDPFPMSLGFVRADVDATTAELTFAPLRDEAGSLLSVRLVFDDGTMALAEVPGGSTDVGLLAAGPASTSVVAHPGDDLNDLANRFGTVRLAAGEYRLERPLVLNNPVTITADPGATLRFAQPADAAPWTAAIKIHAAHTTLDGFAVRFDGPVRWDRTVSYGPAIIGTTDSRDGRAVGSIIGLAFTRLDIEAPSAASAGTWEEAPGLFRLVSAHSGRIEGNRLKGGTIEFFRGPWRVAGNDYLGTMPGTFTYTFVAGHDTRNLEVIGNRVEPRGASGKTWRFLVLTGSGYGDRVAGNVVRGVGPRADDTIPNMNAPEIILTESYRLRFEGHPLAISANGRIVQIPAPQGEPGRAGDIVAILSGPEAGTWRRIVQALDARTYLLDAPLPSGDYALSIAPGFVGATFQGNTLDTRGGPGAANLILAGNHFGTRVVENLFQGSGFRIVAAASESPEHWGWSHAPMFGLHVVGNILEDTDTGASLAVEHSRATRPNSGRAYFTGILANNTFSWSDAYLATRLLPTALTLGDPESIDPAELRLGLVENRTLTPGAIIRINSGQVNGQELTDATAALPLPPRLGAPGGLRLVFDTGVDARDRITFAGHIRFDVVPGAVAYEYRVGIAGTAHTTTVMSVLPDGLVPGPNTVIVRAIDRWGQRGDEAALTFVLDSIAPITDPPELLASSDTGISNGDRITATNRPEFVVAGDPTDRIALRRNGAIVAARVGGGLLADPQTPADGVHAYSLVRIDAAGNTSVSRPLHVTIDITPPSAIEGLARLADGRVVFAPTATTDTYEYRVNADVAWRSIGTATAFLPGRLTLGRNEVAVRSRDAAGNAGPERVLVFQITPPAAVAVPAALPSPRQVTRPGVRVRPTPVRQSLVRPRPILPQALVRAGLGQPAFLELVARRTAMMQRLRSLGLRA